MTYTVFTPTYNRANTLHRVYDSLKAQSYQGFEWIIIDDGSLDNTKEVVNKWQNENLFPISYYYQENKGKHFAHNKALEEAKGLFFVIADSDDAFKPISFEYLLKQWSDLPRESVDKFWSILTTCENQYGKLVGRGYPSSVFISDFTSAYYKHRAYGEKWLIGVTDILRKYPFPEDKPRHYYPEGIIWNQISLKYKTLCINEPLRIYYEDTSSIMRQNLTISKMKKNAENAILDNITSLNTSSDFFIYNPLQYFKNGIQVVRFVLHLLPNYFILKLNFASKIILIFCLFPGLVYFAKDKIVLKN